MRTFSFAAILAVARLVFGVASKASAHPPSTPKYRYYDGVAPHDLRPHWHTTSTPFGTISWTGNGLHDFIPHWHVRPAYSYGRYYSRYSTYRDSRYSPYYGRPHSHHHHR